ncbi:hypothetical protein C491_10389 [Natronococcus amylolyticus DSM 10524]|uniref:Uncharacterized protein n=1 Tax=Natronococcus amylolyticus DSM 10524 TaxID=1227497 RepID=L9X9B5_9EURY|nr:hypothetical protein [Natronococcus amylolyticus]ELY58197.1 hypothetical protein C491_10389 [Natronococcus amylolyticus DSM 10524]
MGPIERFEEEYLDVSTSRATIRELLELFVGAVLFVLVAGALTWYLLGATIATYVAAGLAIVFAITIVSQTYWAITGRNDYRE